MSICLGITPGRHCFDRLARHFSPITESRESGRTVGQRKNVTVVL
jgi:hypothetical protein